MLVMFFWNSFLAMDPSEVWWQMNDLINSEQPKMCEHKIFNRPLGNFGLSCITLQHSALWEGVIKREMACTVYYKSATLLPT